MSPAANEYQLRLAARTAALEEADARHFRLGLGRLVTVAFVVAALWLAWSGSLSGWWALVPLAAFFALGHRMRLGERSQQELSRAIHLYERGLERLADRWSGTGPAGTRFLDHDHAYARDLDLFGEGSLFQLLCAARTGFGQETLAGWLLEAASPESIRERQTAVEELSGALDLREELSVLGAEVGATPNPRALLEWGERSPELVLSPASRALAWAGSALGLLAFFAVLAHLAAQFQLVSLADTTLATIRVGVAIVIAVLGVVTWRTRRETAAVLTGVGETARELGLLRLLLERVETADVASPLLTRLRSRLDGRGSSASERIARLDRLMQLVDSRQNNIVQVLGIFLLWDLHLGLALERWRRLSGPELRGWLGVVGAFEALSSLARYRYERPDTVVPEIAEEGPVLAAAGLGHPLLPADRLVLNDVSLGERAHVLIVSGSNMSGKSTLLRTVGVAAVMAQAGGTVRATSIRLSPLAIGASLRIQDSLKEGTSRFYAEILRLRTLVELADGETSLLFLIDEFLHGTNSHDRQAGAEAIVTGLVERGAIGLVTTHDLALTHIADTLGEAGTNVHFADDLVDGRMHFDYRLREGVVRKSNAIELMRSVGLDV